MSIFIQLVKSKGFLLSNFAPFSQLLLERLRNENEDKTKPQSFNQYSENETRDLAPKYPESFQSCVFVLFSFSFRNLPIDMMRSHADLILVLSQLPT